MNKTIKNNKIILTILLITILFFLSTINVNANIKVAYEPINNKITQSETASFYIILENNNTKNETVRLLFEDTRWIFRTEPLSYYFTGIQLKPGEKKVFPVYIKPTVSLPYNTYLLSLDVKTENENKKITLPILLRIPGAEIGEYLTAVSKFVELPLQQDPREKLPIKINLRNRNPKNIENFTIIINSKYFYKTIHTNLKPLEKKTITEQIQLPKLPPQKIDVNITFIADGEELTPKIKESFYIIGYEDIKKNVTEKKGFFRKEYTYNYKNEGNEKATIEESIKTNFFSKPFITILEDNNIIEKTTITNETGTYIVWKITLKPEEEKTYTIIYNYILLFWIIVFLIIGVFVYNMMKSPIEIKKDAVVVGVSEGGISEIRVVLHLKNLTGKRYKNINVIDIIPKLAEFIPEKDEYNQSRVYNNKNEGSIVKWNIDSLEKYEERILTYRIKSKLSILGGLTLPRAILRFTDETGTEQVTRSNTVKITL